MPLEIRKLSEMLYEFNETADLAGTGEPRPYVDAYLVIGSARAALIDSLMNAAGLYEEVRKITALPVDVLLTHGHVDHVGVSLREFAEAGCPIYMASADIGLLAGRTDLKEEWFTDLKDGDCFDLGGCRLETIACAGHTGGSVVFLDRERQLLFSGDTIGSGSFWMQIPSSLPIAQLRDNLIRMIHKLDGLERLIIYPGHHNQSPAPLTGQYVKDTLHIAEGLLDGSIVGEDRELDFPGRHMKYKSAAYGQMPDFCYDPDRLN